ncbi:trehalose-6-phosphate synthase [Halodesulfovibrio sp.]|jgi:trehalose 6-phosphate synthase|uniref:alpha,alpha-trehalose-phosphate synthase (UDP-forming) n=1 Tax=Halodesulfovibrio sp. TaxID=1912772 RepID=UPI0025F9A8E0|nr:trehalose-6-phosphate synthase [Halodesulfovibrio sp.]MCT4533866.1 trehalose-6-phosphate synthase [Halodesulfovibrio sp.]
MSKTFGADQGVIVVSNRLPVSLECSGGTCYSSPVSGGLVTALSPVLTVNKGTWIGWSGAPDVEGVDEALRLFSKETGYTLQQVGLTSEQIEKFYFGFTNQIIWPLFHDSQFECNFDPDFWQTYLDVNALFACRTVESGESDDYVWVHDYHLMHVAKYMREAGDNRRTGFFLHIPFPSADSFRRLPWRSELLHGLLEYDQIGFQTLHDRRNFIQAISVLAPHIKVTGRGQVVTAKVGTRSVKIGAFPISIDYKKFYRIARSAAVRTYAQEVHNAFPHKNIVLGVDRLDYTKGIPQRLQAMHKLLTMYPELQGEISLLQVVVPSRATIPLYAKLKKQIERLVGQINGEFSKPGYVPIHYQYRNLAFDELLAYYRASRIALVTPLRDGMNLVAKEYCAANVERNGTLILSEFAGAAAQLRNGAILVNPFDVEGVAAAIHQAYMMEEGERRRRMDRMRESIRKNDIFKWVDSFFASAFTT